MEPLAGRRFYHHPERRYWNLIDVETGQVAGTTLRPTLRATVEAEIREIADDGYEFRLEPLTEDAFKKRMTSKTLGIPWAMKLIAARERAHRKPMKRADIESLKEPADGASLEPGIVIDGWGIHLVFCHDESDDSYHYALLAHRFDGQFSEIVTTQLNTVLMALGAIPAPEPVLLDMNLYYFFWKADVDVPLADA